METLSPLRGIIPPLVLPMAADGSIDMLSLGRQIEFLLCAEVDGLWVNGTTGEFYALEPGERCRPSASSNRSLIVRRNVEVRGLVTLASMGTSQAMVEGVRHRCHI